jgi:hypothetical protein
LSLDNCICRRSRYIGAAGKWVPANVERYDGCSGKESREEDHQEEGEEEALVAFLRLTLIAAAVRDPGRRSFFVHGTSSTGH